jgi:hypothetical protein
MAPTKEPRKAPPVPAAEIDTTALDELTGLAREQSVIAERLAQLEARRESVSAVVFERVAGDYSNRHAELVQSAEPLRQRAHRAYQGLRAQLATVAATLEALGYDREEAELRHTLGELELAAYEARTAELAAASATAEGERETLEALQARFRMAFVDPDELDRPLAETAPAAPAPAVPRPEETGVLLPEVTGVLDTERLPLSGETAILPQELLARMAGLGSPVAAAQRGPEATFILRRARLSVEGRDRKNEDFELFVTPFSFGRAPGNDVRSEDLRLARKHAEILATPAGYELADLGSESGTFVNDQRVERRLLAAGDRIRIADLVAVFHGPTGTG